MRIFRTYTVRPSLPESLKALYELSVNLFWSWNSEYVELFRRIDKGLWEQCGHNPVALLGSVTQERLVDLSENEGFLYQLEQAMEKLRNEMEAPTWFDQVYGGEEKPVIAYFSAEYGLHESLPIYSGGLGVLAGDHLKSASDLGVPLVAVGLLYQKGYFRQYLNTDGWQQEHLVENEFHAMPVELVRKKSKRPVRVSVQFPNRNVKANIWKVQVGRVSLYLLDTNIPENSVQDRRITEQLYGGDTEMRIQQEMILGIGGLKALRLMGIIPTVCHMNEGHAAFMALERIRRLRSDCKLSFDEAVLASRAGNVFTVHTPVAAGNDEFTVDLIDKYFSHYYGKLGLNRKSFLALGRLDPEDENEKFKMPVLALRMSSFSNGVSELHGYVSRKIWKGIWPDLPVDEVPIRSITNGIHAKSWISTEMDLLFERYLGADWAEQDLENLMWDSLDNVPDEELWRIHQRGKERLISFAREKLRRQLQRRGTYHTELRMAEEILNPEALIVGFARRFATYKRGNLILKYPDRLKKLLLDTHRPIQFVFAGKAHPRDAGGKDLIRQIVHFGSQEGIRTNFVFIEDYDIDVARHLVQGVDVWLNNPRRPLEASGTSGMKAALNGVMNLSTLDGWWCEGYTPDSGWVIGAGEEYEDKEYQDKIEAEALYNLLENEIVPLYYNRPNERIPRIWIKRMKNTIKWCAPRFNTSRMVAEYVKRSYKPSAMRWNYLTGAEMNKVRDLAAWKGYMREHWEDLRIEDVQVQVVSGADAYALNIKQPQLEVGSNLRVRAALSLGKLKPDDISVQVYHGPIDSHGHIEHGSVTTMNYKEGEASDKGVIFEGDISCMKSGQHGFCVRVIPHHPDLSEPHTLGLMLWENVIEEQVQKG